MKNSPNKKKVVKATEISDFVVDATVEYLRKNSERIDELVNEGGGYRMDYHQAKIEILEGFISGGPVHIEAGVNAENLLAAVLKKQMKNAKEITKKAQDIAAEILDAPSHTKQSETKEKEKGLIEAERVTKEFEKAYDALNQKIFFDGSGDDIIGTIRVFYYKVMNLNQGKEEEHVISLSLAEHLMSQTHATRVQYFEENLSTSGLDFHFLENGK